jgi:hypothetical protein
LKKEYVAEEEKRKEAESTQAVASVTKSPSSE